MFVRKIDEDPYQTAKQIYRLEDSIIKHVKGYNIVTLLENCKVYVKDFSGVRRTFLSQNREKILST